MYSIIKEDDCGMIIYSENRLVPTEVNMLVIKGKDSGYFYVHRALYDQAVIIHDLFGENPAALFAELTGSTEEREDVGLFLEDVPAPLNILGAYLLLVSEPIDNLIDMIGAIHVMSGPINFRKLLQVPMEIRTTPKFSLSIKEEYQLAWDRFFQNALPYSEDMFFQNNAPMNGVATETNSDYEKEDGELSNVGEDGEVYENPLEALLFGAGDDIFDLDDDDLSDDADDSNSEVPTATNAYEPEPAVEPEPEPTPEPVPIKKKLTGIDALLGGGL